MESLRYDIEPFGIKTMAVEPGFFRTELLVEGASTIWPELDIEDYAELTAQTIAAWKLMNGQQGGDPKKLAACAGHALRLGRAAAAVPRRRRRHGRLSSRTSPPSRGRSTRTARCRRLSHSTSDLNPFSSCGARGHPFSAGATRSFNATSTSRMRMNHSPSASASVIASPFSITRTGPWPTAVISTTIGV